MAKEAVMGEDSRLRRSDLKAVQFDPTYFNNIDVFKVVDYGIHPPRKFMVAFDKSRKPYVFRLFRGLEKLSKILPLEGHKIQDETERYYYITKLLLLIGGGAQTINSVDEIRTGHPFVDKNLQNHKEIVKPLKYQNVGRGHTILFYTWSSWGLIKEWFLKTDDAGKILSYQLRDVADYTSLLGRK